MTLLWSCGERPGFGSDGRRARSRGWRRKRRAIVTIGSGMVAENSIVCRSCRQQRQDLLNIVEEAQVKHAIGLVEHEPANATEIELLALGQGRAGGRACRR